MRRRTVLLSIALALALAGAPAAAAAQTTAAVRAIDNAFTPSAVTIAAGGTVSFTYAGGGNDHNVDFGGGPAPTSCSGLPAAPTDLAWSGDCTFATPGSYRFVCDVHAPGMSGTVSVTDASSPLPPPPPPPPPPARPTPPTGPAPAPPGVRAPAPGAAPAPPGGGPPPVPNGPGSPGAPGSPGDPGGTRGDARRPVAALQLAATQRGPHVRGSIAAGARRARLLVQLRVGGEVAGQLRRMSAGPGRIAFTVALDRSARRALERAGRLTVRVRIVLTPAGGNPRTHVRTVTLRTRAAAR